MCPPCRNILKLVLIIAFPDLPSHSKEKKSLTPLLFCSKLFWPRRLPPGKTNQVGLDPPPPPSPTIGLILPAREEMLSREATALNARKT